MQKLTICWRLSKWAVKPVKLNVQVVAPQLWREISSPIRPYKSYVKVLSQLSQSFIKTFPKLSQSCPGCPGCCATTVQWGETSSPINTQTLWNWLDCSQSDEDFSEHSMLSSNWMSNISCAQYLAQIKVQSVQQNKEDMQFISFVICVGWQLLKKKHWSGKHLGNRTLYST